jgi:hypothetical protein
MIDVNKNIGLCTKMDEFNPNCSDVLVVHDNSTDGVLLAEVVNYLTLHNALDKLKKINEGDESYIPLFTSLGATGQLNAIGTIMDSIVNGLHYTNTPITLNAIDDALLDRFYFVNVILKKAIVSDISIDDEHLIQSGNNSSLENFELLYEFFKNNVPKRQQPLFIQNIIEIALRNDANHESLTQQYRTALSIMTSNLSVDLVANKVNVLSPMTLLSKGACLYVRSNKTLLSDNCLLALLSSLNSASANSNNVSNVYVKGGHHHG